MSIAITLIKIVFYFIAFIAIVFMAYYSTKFIANKSNSIVKNDNVNVIDTINLGNNNRIVIMKIFTHLYILSVSNNQTTLIDKIPENEVDVSYEEKSITKHNFQGYLDSILNNSKVDKKGKEIKTDKVTDILGLNNRLLELKDKISNLTKDNAYDIQNNEDENDEKK